MSDVTIYAAQLDWGGFLTLLLTVGLPILVSLVTKRSWTSRVKALLLLFLASLSTFVAAWVSAINDDIPFNLMNVAVNALLGFLLGVAAHFGLWRPTSVSDLAQDTLVTDDTRRN